MSENSTHREYVGEGYSVWIRYCLECNEYLGVEYPSDYCWDHDPNNPKNKK